MTASRKLTGGSFPSCSHLWTASRPVKTTPVSSTMSPTLSLRILSSVKGALSWIISIEPLLDLALRRDLRALAAIGPAHVRDADEIGRRNAVQRADLHAHERGLAAEAH